MRIAIVSLIVFPFCMFSQTIEQINKKIDSLKNEQQNIQQRIRAYEEMQKRIQNEIIQLEQKKSQLMHLKMQDYFLVKVSSSGSILRDKPSSLGTEISTIPPNTQIKVFKEQQNLYLKAEYNGKIGYVSYSTLIPTPELDNFLEGKEVIIPEQPTTSETKIIKNIDTSDPRYQKLKNLYGHDNAIRILNKEVWKGMTMGMTIESIGKPLSKQSFIDEEGNKEVWEYNNYTIQFTNGSISKIIYK
ncbi:MAG: SH3 domain-containing protein [Bacteroidales bacterium]|nr:SH3 domain-containing protein [Bacteroidales bacterium]